MIGPEFMMEPELAQKSQYWRGAPELEGGARIEGCQNWRVPDLKGARFGGCQIWRVSDLERLPVLELVSQHLGLFQDEPQKGRLSSENSEVKRPICFLDLPA